MRRPTLALIVCAALVAAAGCGGGDESSALVDGRHYGYIRALETSSAPATMTLDVAEFLTGDDANRAAVEDGLIEEGEAVPNDYYVRNPAQSTLVVPVAADVEVTHFRCAAGCEQNLPGTFEDLVDSFRDPDPKSLADEYRGAESQYWVTVEDGTVVAIDEQYLP